MKLTILEMYFFNMSRSWIETKMEFVLTTCYIMTLYSLASVQIFSSLFSIHTIWYCQGNLFDNQEHSFFPIILMFDSAVSSFKLANQNNEQEQKLRKAWEKLDIPSHTWDKTDWHISGPTKRPKKICFLWLVPDPIPFQSLNASLHLHFNQHFRFLFLVLRHQSLFILI